jgi:hypothetical protein
MKSLCRHVLEMAKFHPIWSHRYRVKFSVEVMKKLSAKIFFYEEVVFENIFVKKLASKIFFYEEVVFENIFVKKLSTKIFF